MPGKVPALFVSVTQSFMLLCATLQNPFCRKHFRSHSRSQFQRVFFPVVARNSKIRTCPLSTFVARKHNALAANRIETLAFMARYTTLRNPPQSQSFRLPVFKPGLRSAQLLEQQKGNTGSVWSGTSWLRFRNPQCAKESETKCLAQQLALPRLSPRIQNFIPTIV